MTAEALLSLVTQLLFVAIFGIVAWRAFERPTRVSIDTALFFGALAVTVGLQWFTSLSGVNLGPFAADVATVLIMAVPYLLLRLVDDFADVPTWLMRAAAIALGLLSAAIFVVSPPLPLGITESLIAYFAGLQIYAAVAFVREARRTSGVTRRRMETVAAGSAALALALILAGFSALLPAAAPLLRVLTLLAGLGAGIGYFLGFAPPGTLRRAWQEPELRAFLGRAASLPRLSGTDAIVAELERGAAASVGVPRAAIGLRQGHDETLRFLAEDESTAAGWPEPTVTRAFAEQRAVFTENGPRQYPGYADLYKRLTASAVMAAPITAGSNRLGVLAVYAPRAPIFADDDLVLVQLLADQAAVILESRALIDEAGRAQAREEAARLKSDFLSSAAHDLRTPLTTVVAQAQLLERRARLRPTEPPDLEGVQRVVKEASRLRDLVSELLDVSRVQEGQLLGARTPFDVVSLASAVAERHSRGRHRVEVKGDGPVEIEADRPRIEQVIDNLVGNGVKYTPAGGAIEVHVRADGDQARVEVRDQGIGIPPEDLPHVFERFHRGTNVDDRRFAGLGLGLFICRGIVEQHGGRIWATSTLGAGSTFHVTLPLRAGVPV